MGKETRSDNSHLQALTSARFAHVGASTTRVVRDRPGRLIRVSLNTNGGVVIVRDGSDVIASIAADAPEGDFEYGVYCKNNITVDTGASCDVTVVFET